VTLLLAALLAAKVLVPPPATLNIVHHHLKRGAPVAYQSVEASIVNAYERAKIPLYWLTFQSAKDPRDLVYLNVFGAPDDLKRASDTYKSLAPAHPELARLSARLASLVDSQDSVLTTRRDEVSYLPSDGDFATMRALFLATFRVTAGHEGQFMETVRAAAGSGAPWMIYESTADPTFVLLWPLRSRADGRSAAIPRLLRRLRHGYIRTNSGLYTLSSTMSRVPAAFVARSKSAAPKPKAH